jgi:hypothetical protein
MMKILIYADKDNKVVEVRELLYWDDERREVNQLHQELFDLAKVSGDVDEPRFIKGTAKISSQVAIVELDHDGNFVRFI